MVTLARAGCNEVEIYSITGHKPSDVQAILTTHYLPRDAEVASNAIAKLNQYKAQKVDKKTPDYAKNREIESEKVSMKSIGFTPVRRDLITLPALLLFYRWRGSHSRASPAAHFTYGFRGGADACIF